MKPRHSLPLLILFSGAVLVTAPAQDAPAGSPQKSADAAAGPILSEEQVQKLITVTQTRGRSSILEQPISLALGLTKGDEKLPVRQLTLREGNRARHVFQKVPDGGYVFALAAPGTTYAFRTDKDLALKAAISWPVDATAPVAMPAADAQKPFEAELKRWAEAADKL